MKRLRTRDGIAALLLTTAPAVGADVALDAGLPAVPTGLLFDKGAFYGGAIVGVNSYGTIYQLVPPSKAKPEWSVKIVYAFEDAQGTAPTRTRP